MELNGEGSLGYAVKPKPPGDGGSPWSHEEQGGVVEVAVGVGVKVARGRRGLVV